LPQVSAKRTGQHSASTSHRTPASTEKKVMINGDE
jgi:hypothetical protein